jgi:hypothetical protein
MPNITSTDVTEKRISLVYNSDISGFQALDFSKIDGIETLLNSFVVTGQDLPSGLKVYQSNLNKDLDYASVYISGDALTYLSSIVTSGVSLKGVNTVQVNVTGGSLNVLNEVEIKNDTNNPVPVSGTVTIGNNPLIVSGTVTAIQEKNSNISNFTVSGTNGTVLAANSNRKELFVQNLSTSHLHVKYGASAAGNSFNFVLASSTASGVGDGGSLSDLNYTGIVSVSGVSPNYICWERS